MEDVDSKFEELKKLQDNNWIDDKPKPVVKKVKVQISFADKLVLYSMHPLIKWNKTIHFAAGFHQNHGCLNPLVSLSWWVGLLAG